MADSVQNLLFNSGVIDKLSQNYAKYGKVAESKSIFTVFEQRMFFWHDAGSSILTVEAKLNESSDTSACQVLMLTNPPVFDVEFLVFNRTGTLLMLAGQDGVMVVEVPLKSGTLLASSGEKEKNLFCRSWNVAERFFVCSSRIKVVQAAWHPGSPYSTHLTILSSDNCIRIYDVTDAQVPQTAVSLASSSKSFYLSSDSKASFSVCLGESAVSFDFGPSANVCPAHCTKLQSEHHDHCQYPIFVLYGNGDIYTVLLPIKKISSDPITVEGPLAMYPPSDDNYGVDACSLLCLSAAVPVLVIATASGIIYHCLALARSGSIIDEDNKDEESWSTYNQSDSEGAADLALYVYECVELSSTLTCENSDDAYSRTIKLHKDPTTCSKYHCTHMAGVHSVALPFVRFLEEYADSDDLEILFQQLEGERCIIEHVLCTQPISSVDAIPVLGLGVIGTEKGAVLICLLASWEFTCLPLASSYLTSTPSLLSSDLKLMEAAARGHDIGFEKYLQNLFHHSVSTPLLKSNISPEESKTSHRWLDLLCNITQRLREEYIQRLLSIQAQIECRKKILTQLKHQQVAELEKCLHEKDLLRNAAEHLAEKYDDAHTKQQALLGRIEKVLQLLHNKLPVLSNAELNMKKDLKTFQEKLNFYQNSLEQIRMKQAYQTEKAKEFENSQGYISATKRPDNINMGGSQLKHLKEILATEGKSISDLLKMVCTLKKEVGL